MLGDLQWQGKLRPVLRHHSFDIPKTKHQTVLERHIPYKRGLESFSLRNSSTVTETSALDTLIKKVKLVFIVLHICTTYTSMLKTCV